MSSEKAVSVQLEQNKNREGKDDILRALNQFEVLFSVDSIKWAREEQNYFL
ncbi:MAG: hypothetical protein IPL24_16070 [Bacteroidetes bacterium]|nr:hypothetical protein [Bacteroidota bacterium]